MMSLSALFCVSATLALLVSAAPSPAIKFRGIYFQTNDVSSNWIVATQVHTDGRVTTKQTITPTGGQGAYYTNATGFPAAADRLDSQGSVTICGNLLFAVNAGSDTVSMLQIGRPDGLQLKMVGKPQNTLGQFPVSVACSLKLRMACVLNSGKVAGVTCFRFTSATGLSPALGGMRPITLNQTTPPVGPLGTGSQVFFAPDGSALLATIKGQPSAGVQGYLAAYPINALGDVSMTAIKSYFPGTTILFGVAYATPDLLVVSDASVGAATVAYNASTHTAALAMYGGKPAITAVAGQIAICWAVYSPVTKTAFLSEAGRGLITEIDPFAGGAIVSQAPPAAWTMTSTTTSTSCCAAPRASACGRPPQSPACTPRGARCASTKQATSSTKARVMCVRMGRTSGRCWPGPRAHRRSSA